VKKENGSMKLSDRETLTLMISAVLLLSIFGYANWLPMSKRNESWEVKVFDYEYKEAADVTYVYSYGNGYHAFLSKHEFETGETYLIVYRPITSKRGEIVSMEKT